MYFEYRVFIKELVTKWCEYNQYQIAEIENFQISTPPSELNALVGTNIAFILAKKVKIEPIALCSALVNFNSSESAFDLYATSSGFINANPRGQFLFKYFSEFSKKITSDSFFSFNTFNTINAILSSENEDLKKLLKPELSETDFIMLLAILGDDELSADPYLQGLKGKENIPWLLEQFSRDWRRVVKASTVDNFVLNDFSPSQLEQSFDFAFREQLRALMCLRNFDSLERLFPFCLSLVSTFYECYNQPSFRQALESKELGRVGLSTNLLGLAIESVLNSLREFAQSTRVLQVR